MSTLESVECYHAEAHTTPFSHRVSHVYMLRTAEPGIAPDANLPSHEMPNAITTPRHQRTPRLSLNAPNGATPLTPVIRKAKDAPIPKPALISQPAPIPQTIPRPKPAPIPEISREQPSLPKQSLTKQKTKRQKRSTAVCVEAEIHATSTFLRPPTHGVTPPSLPTSARNVTVHDALKLEARARSSSARGGRSPQQSASPALIPPINPVVRSSSATLEHTRSRKAENDEAREKY